MNKLLVGVLAASLGRDVGHGALQNLQESLLHPFAAHVPGDGRILRLAGNLVQLVDVNNPFFRPADVKIRRLDQAQKDVLHILPHISRLGEGGGVRNGEGDPQHPGQGLGQQGFAHTGGTQQHDVALLEFHIPFGAEEDTLIVVVHRHRKGSFGLVLPHYILVQEALNLPRLGDSQLHFLRRRPPLGRGRFVLQNRLAEIHAFVADADPRPGNHPLDLILGLAAEGAAQLLLVVTICHNTASSSCLSGPGAGRIASYHSWWVIILSIRP